MHTPLFYREKPLFGVDIGHNTIKVMQIDTYSKSKDVIGYGHINFDDRAIKQGVIIDPEALAKAVYTLITKHLIGKIDTKRVVTALPNANVYNRVVQLPQMDKKDLQDAVVQEAEQYVPLPLENTYIDWEISRNNPDGSVEVLTAIAPKNIVDSYAVLFELLDLELASLQTNLSAVSNIVMHAEHVTERFPTMVIDFGAVTSDLALYDNTIRVTDTSTFGGEQVSDLIAKSMKVTPRQAYTIKTRYGIDPSKKQTEIVRSLKPMLTQLMSEIKKMIRFYQERDSSGKKVEQIVLVGGGANLPGLAAYITDEIRIPTRLLDPWQNINFGKLQPPHKLETTLYTTVAGLAISNPGSIHD